MSHRYNDGCDTRCTLALYDFYIYSLYRLWLTFIPANAFYPSCPHHHLCKSSGIIKSLVLSQHLCHLCLCTSETEWIRNCCFDVPPVALSEPATGFWHGAPAVQRTHTCRPLWTTFLFNSVVGFTAVLVGSSDAWQAFRWACLEGVLFCSVCTFFSFCLCLPHSTPEFDFHTLLLCLRLLVLFHLKKLYFLRFRFMFSQPCRFHFLAIVPLFLFCCSDHSSWPVTWRQSFLDQLWEIPAAAGWSLYPWLDKLKAWTETDGIVPPMTDSLLPTGMPAQATPSG